MRHKDIKLTMGVYTDPKLLDVRGALEALPALPLECGQAEQRAARATGTYGEARTVAPLVAPTVALTSDSSVQGQSIPDHSFTDEILSTLAISLDSVNGKGRLSSSDNRPSCRGDWI